MSTPPSTPQDEGKTIDRRKMLKLLGAVPAAAMLAPTQIAAASTDRGVFGKAATAKKAGTVNVYTWPDYFDPSILTAFTKETGITVNISTYDDNSEAFAKLNSSAGESYDIVIPSSSWVKEFAAKGLLAKLDHGLLNLSAIDSGLLGRNYDEKNTYSIPKDWGVLGVVYNPTALGGDIRTWKDFYTYGAKPGVSGKVRMSDSAYETIGTQLWIAGVNWNTSNESLIEAAANKVKAFAPNVSSFESFDPSTTANGSIVLAQTDQAGARAALEQTPSLKWVVPGPTSELWVDNYAISAKAPHIGAAYTFLNYQLESKVQIAQTQYVGYPAALNDLESKLPATTKDRSLIFGGANLNLKSLTSYIVNPNTAALWEQLQNEIQAAAG